MAFQEFQIWNAGMSDTNITFLFFCVNIGIFTSGLSRLRETQNWKVLENPIDSYLHQHGYGVLVFSSKWTSPQYYGSVVDARVEWIAATELRIQSSELKLFSPERLIDVLDSTEERTSSWVIIIDVVYYNSEGRSFMKENSTCNASSSCSIRFGICDLMTLFQR